MEKPCNDSAEHDRLIETELRQRVVDRASASSAALQTHLQHHQDRRRFQETSPEYQMVTRYHERLLHRSAERQQQAIAALREPPPHLSGSPDADAHPRGSRESAVGQHALLSALQRLLRTFRGAK